MLPILHSEKPAVDHPFLKSLPCFPPVIWIDRRGEKKVGQIGMLIEKPTANRIKVVIDLNLLQIVEFNRTR